MSEPLPPDDVPRERPAIAIGFLHGYCTHARTHTMVGAGCIRTPNLTGLLTRANTLRSHSTHGQRSLPAGGEFAVAEVVAADGAATVVDIATAQ